MVGAHSMCFHRAQSANTLGPGVVGHLLHARTISPVTFVAVDRWFAYDQVGSILAETDADGELAATHHADAWGNRLEDEDESWGHYVTTITTPDGRTLLYDQYITPVPIYGRF